MATSINGADIQAIFNQARQLGRLNKLTPSPEDWRDCWISSKAALDETAPPPSPNPAEYCMYALFLCHPNGYCEIRGEVRMGSVHDTYEERPFDSLRACRSAAYANSSGRVPNAQGRTMLSDGSWWECRSKPIDTWERDPGR